MDAYYDSGLDLAGGGTGAGNTAWETATWKALLTKNTYTFDQTQVFVADLVPATYELAVAGYARATLTGLTRTVDGTLHRAVYLADPLDFATPAIGGTYRYAVLYQFVSTDANSPLYGAYDLGGGGGIATTGSPLVIPTLTTGLAYVDDQT